MKPKVARPRSLIVDLRPEYFREVVGQELILRALKNMIASNTIPNGIIFTGEIGAGKSTLARLLTKATSCSGRRTGNYEPCGHCDSCETLRSDCWSLDVTYLGSGSNPSLALFMELVDDGINGTLCGTATRHALFIDDFEGLSKKHQTRLRSALDVKWGGYLVATSAAPEKIDPALRSRMMEFALSPPDQPSLEAWLERLARGPLGLQIDERHALGQLARLGELRFRPILKILQGIYAGGVAISTTNVQLAALQCGFGPQS